MPSCGNISNSPAAVAADFIAGAIKVARGPVAEQNLSPHLLGTCRMGNDPNNSVIDRHHRTHDVRSLFLCDGNSFVSSGRGQPTMTIQARAFRAAEHIGRFARRGEMSPAARNLVKFVVI